MTTVEFLYTTGAVTGSLTPNVNTVDSVVLTALLTALGFVAVLAWNVLVVLCLETIALFVGVVPFTVAEEFVRVFEIKTGRLRVVFVKGVGEEVRFVTFGTLVVRAVLFRKVLFEVRVLLRFVNVVLRVGVVPAVFSILSVLGVGEV